MKLNKVFGFVLALGFSTQAMAGTIHCHYSTSPLFGVLIETGPFDGGTLSGASASAEITISGPRLLLIYPPESTTLYMKKIRTRVEVGEKYYAKLGEDSFISLKHLFAYENSDGYQSESFMGVYSNSGQETALTCEVVE